MRQAWRADLGPAATRAGNGPLAALWLAVATGVALRAVSYAANWSLRADEAALAWNVLERCFAGLLLPLQQEQVAPLGFLWTVKAGTLVLGTSELALRFVPWLTSVAAVPLFARLSRQHLAPWPAVVGTLFLAVNPMSNQFAAEIKQYSTDECATIVLLLVLSRVAGSGWVAGRRNLTLLSSAGALAVLFSLPSCFVLAGVGAVCIACPWRAGKRRDARAFAAVAAGWLLPFTLGYVLLYSHAATSPYLKEFWAGSHLELPLSSEALRADVEVLRRLVGPFFGSSVGWRVGTAAGFLAIGTAGLFRQSRVLLAALATTVGVAGLASGLGVYPLVERQAMFLTPAFALLVGALAAGRPGTAGHLAGALAAAGLVLPAASATWRTRIAGEDQEAIRTVLSAVSDRFEAGDTIYVYCATTNQYAYYRKHRPDVVRLASARVLMPARQPGLRANHACSASFAIRERATVEELDRLGREHTGRFWLVLSHGVGVDPGAFLAALERHGDLADAIDEPGALARLYTLRSGGSQPGNHGLRP